MNDLKTVIGFTIKDMVKRKSFIISTLIILLIIIIGINIPNIIEFFNKSDSKDNNKKLLVVDYNNVFEGSLETLSSMDLGYEVSTTNENLSLEDIRPKIENKEIDEALIIEKTPENTYRIRYIIEDMTMIQNVPNTLISAINSIYEDLQISKLGLTRRTITIVSS